MKRSMTLRTQLTILMALLVLLQSLSLAMALSFSGVFVMLDTEAFRMFRTTTSARMQAFNTSVGGLVSGMAAETNWLNEQLHEVADLDNVRPEEIYLRDGMYQQAALVAGESLIKLMQNYDVTGAFFMLNASNANKENTKAHSGVYLRNAVPGAAGANPSNFIMEIGPIQVARQNRMGSSVKWKLDIQFESDEKGAYAFYQRPFWAATQFKNAELERYGYWAAPSDILSDSKQVVTYTMPLMDEKGQAYGVLGIEISTAHLTKAYLPNTDLQYPNSFYAIAAVQGTELSLDWVIPSGPIAQAYLKQGERLPLKEVQGTGLYKTAIDGLGDMYCSPQPLTMYSNNSPFVQESWSLVSFVPQAVLRESSSGVATNLVISIITTTLIAVIAVFLLAYAATRKISGLSKYVGSLNPYGGAHFRRTGMREVDELMSAVEMFSQSVISASKTTSKILELTLLPIGGFEITSEASYVILTEFIYKLIHLQPGVLVKKDEWEAKFAHMKAQPAEGYENIYRYDDPALTTPRWLRILETSTPTGCVGVVLDVTHDIEENLRLLHELDFDALTRLYNRTAFRREVFNRILNEPDKVGAMIFSDLDNLKYINDTFGHDVGDRLIIRAGEMFREFVNCGGVVARISGDEFAIYLHGFSTKEDALQVIQRQLKKNEKCSLTTQDGLSHRIRSSSGLAWYPTDSGDVADLIKLADYAMYEAKHSEKGALFEFNHQSYSKNVYLLDNREAINRLLDEKLIRFAYQPIIDLRTGDIFGYEALMRPLLDNFKSPMEILTVAAAQSKLGQLERLVVFTAFQVVEDHIQQLGDTKVFINSIPSQVLSDEDRVDLERSYGHIFKNVVMEITEAENDSVHQMKSKFSYLHEHGIMMAIDDYGSGYSNEVRVLALNPDIIKIDMEIIQGIHQDKDKQKLVSNLVSYCHPKGVKVVAEGVEEKVDLMALIQLDVDYVQGFYTGRPSFHLQSLDAGIRKQIIKAAKAHKATSERQKPKKQKLPPLQ